MTENKEQLLEFEQGESFALFKSTEHLEWSQQQTSGYRYFEREFRIEGLEATLCLEHGDEDSYIFGENPPDKKSLIISLQGPVEVKQSDSAYREIISNQNLAELYFGFDRTNFERNTNLDVSVQGPRINLGRQTSFWDQSDPSWASTGGNWTDVNSGQVYDRVYVPLDATILSTLRFTIHVSEL